MIRYRPRAFLTTVYVVNTKQAPRVSLDAWWELTDWKREARRAVESGEPWIREGQSDFMKHQWLAFMEGFSAWSYRSPRALLWRDLYKDEEHIAMAAECGFSFTGNIPLALANTDSVTDVASEYQRAAGALAAFKQIGVHAKKSETMAWHGMGARKLQQYILVARMARAEMEPLPESHELWREAFLRFMDRESALACLSEISAWPTIGDWVLLTETV